MGMTRTAAHIYDFESWFIAFLLTASLLLSIPVIGQSVSGDLAGVVTDTTGAVIPNVKVVATNLATQVQTATTTNAGGQYHISNLLPGHYTLEIAGSGFAARLRDVEVRLNQTQTANLTASVSGATTTVEVSADAAPIDTVTPQIQSTFEAKQNQDLPEASVGSGVINLSLLNAGVTSAGGIGVGTGPSVSGQRPRNNNFTVEGVDNNAKNVTGPLMAIPNDAVQNFTVLQNQFNPEFGHSSGGQFNQAIKSGTNQFHGTVYEYFRNRNLNAIDASTARNEAPGPYSNPRFDNNRYGGELGGPIIKDKLFFYTLNEYQTVNQLSTTNWCAPTALGYSEISAFGGSNINQTNLAQFQKYVGTASGPGGPDCKGSLTATTNKFLSTDGKSTLGGYEFGQVNATIPNYNNIFTSVNSVDMNISPVDQVRLRYIYSKDDTNNAAGEPQLPIFFSSVPVRQHLFTLGEYHTFSPNVTNEFRFGVNRFSQNFVVGPQTFPGLGVFPNLQIQDLNAIQIGPGPNFPQFTIENIYQGTENIGWVRGKHNFKFGAEGRKYISPQNFTQRSRGDYEYSNFSTYLYDQVPDFFGQRSTGNNIYYGDQSAIYAYANDEFRATQSLTLDIGMRYEFTSVPYTERLQTLNAIASVPGLITFGEPQPQYRNFAPRVGFAYSPGGSGTTSIRGGFAMAYDVLFDNLGILSIPPEFGGFCDVSNGVIPGCSFSTPNGFLAGGGLPAGQGTGLKTFATPAAAIAQTGGYIPNQHLPYSETWDFGIQRSFGRKYTAEVRYVGTRGIHLPVQDQINKQSKVTASQFLPTYLANPGQATLDSLKNTLTSITANSAILPAYAAAGFINTITAYEPYGGSIYHGLQAQLNRSLTNGLQFQAAWTWSHAEDNSTAEVFSTQLTPRRPQDSQNLRADFGTSALDRRHRISLEAIYDVPFFKGSRWFARNFVGNWEIAPVWQFQTPEYFTPQSGIDSNLNGDSAPDRTVFNAAGVPGTGSPVTPLTNSAGQIVAYLAVNPSAMYIQAGKGAVATAMRNTVALPRTNNWDLTAVKRLNLTERTSLEFQVQALNVFNHSQYIPGFVNDVAPLRFITISSFVQVVNPATFNHPQLFFSNNARTMQLVAKFNF